MGIAQHRVRQGKFAVAQAAWCSKTTQTIAVAAATHALRESSVQTAFAKEVVRHREQRAGGHARISPAIRNTAVVAAMRARLVWCVSEVRVLLDVPIPRKHSAARNASTCRAI
jgi:hypothetical protein